MQVTVVLALLAVAAAQYKQESHGSHGHAQSYASVNHLSTIKHEYKHEAPVYKHEPVYIKHEAPVYKHEPVYIKHEAPVYKHEPVYVKHEAPVYVKHEAPLYKQEYKHEPEHYVSTTWNACSPFKCDSTLLKSVTVTLLQSVVLCLLCYSSPTEMN